MDLNLTSMSTRRAPYTRFIVSAGGAPLPPDFLFFAFFAFAWQSDLGVSMSDFSRATRDSLTMFVGRTHMAVEETHGGRGTHMAVGNAVR